MMDREAWCAVVHDVSMVGYSWATEQADWLSFNLSYNLSFFVDLFSYSICYKYIFGLALCIQRVCREEKKEKWKWTETLII